MNLRPILAATLLGLSLGAQANQLGSLGAAGFSATEVSGFQQSSGNAGHILGAVKGVRLAGTTASQNLIAAMPATFENSITLNYIGDPDSSLLLSYHGNGGAGMYNERRGRLGLDTMLEDAPGGDGKIPFGTFPGVDQNTVDGLGVAVGPLSGNSLDFGDLIGSAQVVEPAPALLLGLGASLVAIGARRRRRAA